MLTADNKSSKNLLCWIFAALWFAGWHLWHTWSVWADPINRVPGPIGDNMVMLWNLGWVKHALSHNSHGFWFTNAYYPDGFLFLFSTHTWLDGVLGWLASPLLPSGYQGSILWANMTMLFSTVTTGLLIVGGLRIWGIRQWPLLILVSSAVTFSWFRMFALTGHYHFYGTQWMLAALVMASLGRQSYANRMSGRGIFYFLLAGALTGLAFLNDQTMAVFAALLGLFIVWSTGFGEQKSRITRVFPVVLAYFASALTVASIHLVPIIRAVLNEKLEYNLGTASARLVDATSLILPSDYHFLGSSLTEFRQFHGLQWAEGSYLGIIPILLLVAGTVGAVQFLMCLRKSPIPDLRVCFFAMLAAWIFLLFALGDTLVIGRDTYLALPGRLLKFIPVVNNIRLPQRWIWPAHLCIGLGGALALSYYGRQWSASRYWALSVLAVIPPLEGKVTLPPVDFRNDPFVKPAELVSAVEKNYKNGGVLVMPVEAAYAHGNVLQFLWGYDIPLTVTYTARMPFSIKSLPWRGSRWEPDTGPWLKEKRVSIIVFPFHEGNLVEYQPWLQNAKTSVPDLKVYNRAGNEVSVWTD